MSKLFYLSIIISCFACAAAQAQTNALIRQGNMLYDEKRYKDAATEYNKALLKNPTNTPAMFNLGNSLYQQKQFDATRKVMEATNKVAKDKDSKGEANYTIGNTYMEEKKWEDAVTSYKNALRNNPRDADAKYNLSYAEEMMKKNKNGGGGKNNKDQKNKDNKQDQKQNQNQDQKDKDKQNKDQQNKDQQNKDQDKDKQDQQHPQSQPSKLSQQQADQLLNALQQEEKKLQDKQQKEKGIPVKMDKDW